MKMMGAILKSVFSTWANTWSLRLRELVGMAGWQAWRDGYGEKGIDAVGVLAEASLRILELLGVGLLLQVMDVVLWSGRWRELTEDERAFAKTYFAPSLLDRVRIDESAHSTAGKLNIAYVFGFVINCAGIPEPSLLVHELVHVLQFERWGWAYVAKALWSQHRGAGYHYAAGGSFNLNAEQEAAWLEDRARTRQGRLERWAVI